MKCIVSIAVLCGWLTLYLFKDDCSSTDTHAGLGQKISATKHAISGMRSIDRETRTKRRQPRLFSCKGSGHETSIQSTFTRGHRLNLRYNTTWYPIFTIVGKDELMQRLYTVDVGP